MYQLKCTVTFDKNRLFKVFCNYFRGLVDVLYPKKGVCADPADTGAILGGGGVEPHSGDRERQLAPDIGRGKT
jgi:hypothetical protein